MNAVTQYRQYETRDGGRFSRTTVEDALRLHQRDGIIRGWQRDPRARGASGTRAVPLYVVTLACGREADLATLWEAHAFLNGIATARRALSAGGQL